jgi:hypothetical protein
MLLQALVLLLQSTKKNSKAVLKIYEKLGLFYDIIQYHMDSKDYDMVVTECKKLTEIKNPLDVIESDNEVDIHMYTKILEFFVNETKEKSNTESDDYKNIIRNLEIILGIIKDKKILSPVNVLNILSKGFIYIKKN